MSDSRPEQTTQSIDDLLDSLESVYAKRDKKNDYDAEHQIFTRLIPELVKSLKPLEISRAIALGSTATVWVFLVLRIRTKWIKSG